MSRRRVQRRWKDSYACRRQVVLFFVFCASVTFFFKVLKIVNEEDHRADFHRRVSSKLNYLLLLLNKEP